MWKCWSLKEQEVGLSPRKTVPVCGTHSSGTDNVSFNKRERPSFCFSNIEEENLQANQWYPFNFLAKAGKADAPSFFSEALCSWSGSLNQTHPFICNSFEQRTCEKNISTASLCNNVHVCVLLGGFLEERHTKRIFLKKMNSYARHTDRRLNIWET